MLEEVLARPDACERPKQSPVLEWLEPEMLRTMVGSLAAARVVKESDRELDAESFKLAVLAAVREVLQKKLLQQRPKLVGPRKVPQQLPGVVRCKLWQMHARREASPLLQVLSCSVAQHDQ